MIRIDSKFDGGSIEVIEANYADDIRLAIPKDNQSCTRQWFYFSVESEAQEPQKIRLTNAGDVSFSQAWDGYQAFASNDNVNWHRVNSTFDGKELLIESNPSTTTTFYAYFVPYSLQRQDDLIEQLSQHTSVQIEQLTYTSLGNSVPLIKFGDYDIHKKNVWVIARQHPGETMAQWIAEGFVKDICEKFDSGTASDINLFVVLNMNPDGSYIGNHRTNALGQNLNRCWIDPSQEYCPEVYSVQRAMEKYGVDFFIDMHGDETIPHNFMMGKYQDTDTDEFKRRLASSDNRFQLEQDYDTYNKSQSNSCCGSGCKSDKTATSYVAKQFCVPSILLEASFKELQNGNDQHPWDHNACVDFGRVIAGNLIEHLCAQGEVAS